ncbi:MAG TPA: N-6 DNA methylase [Giesbergeria sp.]|nr:N-6 DNA methylase [Giesbergeria sp.]
MLHRSFARSPHQLTYRAIRIEGGLIPAEELTRLTLLADPKASEQTEAHYRIAKGLKLRDEIARDFKIALALWRDFQALRQRTDADAHALTLSQWLLPLLRDVLHFADAARCPATLHAGQSYAIGHAGNGGHVPLVLAGFDQPLDSAAERFGDTHPTTGKTRRRSPFMLAQEALNASDAALWAIVSNGLTLRILRDNPSLTRPAYIEVDLEAIFTEELLADFSAFWLLAHASRFGSADSPPADCPWERWRAAGQQAGITVRGKLRDQVEAALRQLGTGFLSHPANAALRAALQNGDSGYSRQAFFEELLSLVYRLIFLSTVEDRRDPGTGEPLVFAPDASQEAKARYLAGYSMTWLRNRAVRRSQHDRHGDLWQALSISFDALGRGEPALGLPALGGLFAPGQCPQLDAAQLDNRHLLAAVFQLGWFRAEGGLSRVNYRDMGPEELGSVYESLLELVPDLQGLHSAASARLAFVGDDEASASTRGNTRKLTGSYYTPDSLVQQLIASALEPVIAQTVQAHPQDPVQALLQLAICDPACGSGHFLLAAARRLADEVARQRAAAEREGGAPTPADYRHALRDVVGRCLYGVDKNPMAIQLAKTALWLEAYSPDRPLTFIDHHLRVGDALLGVLDPQVLENGIPDEAYTALSGDDKASAAALKKQNKADLKSWRRIAAGDLITQAGLAAQASSVEQLADDTPEQLAAKRSAWQQAQHAARRTPFARLADTYVAAFLAPKLAGASASTVPLSGYLWGLMSGAAPDDALQAAAQALCRQHGVFHWWLAFPQIAARGGFDVMLGNPPWERIKLQEEEFFATRSPLVAAARNKAERAERIGLLQRGLLLHTLSPDVAAAEGLQPPNRAEMRLYEDFIAARRGAEAASLYAHDSGRYPLTGVGDVNTYALFAETLFQLTAAQGRAGFIVPTGIATDDSTKAYFGHVSQSGRLVSLLDFENSQGVFPAVHRSYKFSLMTLGSAEAAQFVCFATQVEQASDPRRRFTLTPEEFRLINPNTRTCPVFRSQRDAELTKKLYRAAPVLIREAQTQGAGQHARVIEPEANPWGISFQRMLDMSNDSHLFADSAAARHLPLYEAKMIHQFDHRWATYAANPDKPGGVETLDVSPAQKADPRFAVRPRYWVDERQVLARIARVPSRVASAWLAWRAATDAAAADPAAQAQQHAALTLALATWVAGALFRREAMRLSAAPQATASLWEESEPKTAPAPAQQAQAAIKQGVDAPALVWNNHTRARARETTEEQLARHHPQLAQALRADGTSGKKALPVFEKCALQDDPAQGLGLSEAELQHIATQQSGCAPAAAMALDWLDDWMDRRSPRWLMGWRGIARTTDERSVIAAAMPRAGMGNSIHIVTPSHQFSAAQVGGLLANVSSLIFDFVARQKIGGANFNFFIPKQLPVLPPDRYTPADLAFIVPRVLELTHTAHDMQPWADELLAAMPEADPRPPAERGTPLPPFPWNPERRAQLRAELDACYARLYGLTRDELRYILDPADVMGDDYPSETFRVLKNNELRAFREYRTQRLVLEAWDALEQQASS